MTATVVVLPSDRSPVRAAVVDELRSTGTTVLDVDIPGPGASPWSVRTCAAIAAARPKAPLLVVALADGAGLVPAVALAQRTAHRAIAGYVLVEPDGDPSAPDWPDAPVLVIAAAGSEALRRAALRGWEAAESTAPAVIASRIREAGP